MTPIKYSVQEQYRRLLLRSLPRLNGCIEVTAGLNRAGYALVRRGGKEMMAHRLAFEASHGPIPEGMFVLHRCDNRCCVNAAHLFLGTKADNWRDMVNKGRGGWQKVSVDDVQALRSRFASGESAAALQIEFGISSSQFYRIVNGERWRHVA